MKTSPKFELHGYGKAFEIIFDTEEEAQEIINLLEVLKLQSRNTAKEAIENGRKTPEEWEKFGFKITIVKKIPSMKETAICAGLLSEKGEAWIKAEMKKLNLNYGLYLAFEWEGCTVLYLDTKNFE